MEVRYVGLYLVIKRIFRWKLALLMVLVLGGAGVGFGVFKVHAAGCGAGFLKCPGDRVVLEPVNGTFNGTSYNNPRPYRYIAPGQVMDYMVGYDSHDGMTAANTYILTWVNIDINDNGLDAGYSDPATPGSREYGIVLYNVPESHQNGSDIFANCHNVTAATSGTNYNCGEQGRSADWIRFSDPGDDNVERYGIRFMVAPNAASGTAFCIRTHISVGTGGSNPASPNLGTIRPHVQGTSENECYEVKRTTVSGRLYGVDDLGLTTGLIGQGVFNCLSNPTTDASGNFSFGAYISQGFCMRGPTYASAGDTDYVLDSAVNSRVGGLTYENQVAYLNCPSSAGFGAACGPDQDAQDRARTDENEDGGYDLRYRCVASSSRISVVKASSAGAGSVKPGDSITYTITITNSQGCNVPSFQLTDPIPLNMTPTTAAMSANIAGSSVACPVVNAPAYGGVTCRVDSGARPSVIFAVGALPARATTTFSWTGTVKSADNIGIFPTDNSCASGTKSDWSDASALTRDCQDATNGLQGVENRGWISSSAFVLTPVTTTTYNPIPGSAALEKKIVTGKADPRDTTHDLITFGGAYDRATMNLTVRPDTTGGPLQFAVVDQTNGSNTDDGGARIDNALDCITTSGTGSGTFNDCAGNLARWDGISTNDAPAAGVGVGMGASLFSFQADSNALVNTYADQGRTVPNAAKVCWLQTWVAGHPVTCQPASHVVKAVKSFDPYLATDNGNVHAGGGITNAPNGTCTLNTVGGSNYLRGNPGTGRYFVSVANDSASGFGSAAGTTAKGYPSICRPDVVATLKKLSQTSANLQSYTGGKGDYTTGKVVWVPTGTLPVMGSDNLTGKVKGRWTLFVEGNLYIGNNITYTGGATNLENAPSLGVVVTGNIYIAPNVTNLDGYYVAGAMNPATGVTEGGVVKTCANFDGSSALNLLDATTCNTPLTVNGMIMAKTFSFARTTKSTLGPAERLNFTGQFYTATPPGFSDLNRYNPPVYVQERTPRY
jgi:uncharacterized repeat protein (TIGR01451 family)